MLHPDISANKRLLNQVTRRYSKLMNEKPDNMPRSRSASSSSSSSSRAQPKRAKKSNFSYTTDNIPYNLPKSNVTTGRSLGQDQKLYALCKDNPVVLSYLQEKLHQTTLKGISSQKVHQTEDLIAYTQSMMKENKAGKTGSQSVNKDCQNLRNNDVKVDKLIKSQPMNLRDLPHLLGDKTRFGTRTRDSKGRLLNQKNKTVVSQGKSWTPFCLKVLVLNLVAIFILFSVFKTNEVVGLQSYNQKNNLNERGVIRGNEGDESERLNNLDLEFERLNQELEQLIENSQKTAIEKGILTGRWMAIGALLGQLLIWFVMMIWNS